jgi:hypothetical protein
MAAKQPKRRICRTPDEAWQAGWEDGADDPPMTQAQIDRLVHLLRPYLINREQAA